MAQNLIATNSLTLKNEKQNFTLIFTNKHVGASTNFMCILTLLVPKMLALCYQIYSALSGLTISTTNLQHPGICSVLNAQFFQKQELGIRQKDPQRIDRYSANYPAKPVPQVKTTTVTFPTTCYINTGTSCYDLGIFVATRWSRWSWPKNVNFIEDSPKSNISAS